MISTLRYGADASLRLELAGATLLAHCDAPRGEPIRRLAEAVDQALTEPIDFPQLGQSVVPGDKVVLALAHAVPQAGIVVAEIIESLVAAGVAAADITLLRTQADVATSATDPLDEVREDLRRDVVELVHDPDRRETLSYLAAAADGSPIYIHRAIHDADLVISIGCLHFGESLGYHGIHSDLFPTFSDERSQERYRSTRSIEPAEHARLRKRADEAGWLLGVHFTVQVVPGAGSDVLHVLAGEPDAVCNEGCRLLEHAWSYSVPGRASLVVTTIEGDASQQTWENVARALSAASHAVNADGSVAICCELSQRPGPALQRVVGAENLDAALREIGRKNPADALAAAELVRALKRGSVYLLSQLDEDLVEELGMLPVAADQVSRLASRYESCIVLSNAQHAVARPSDEPCDAASPADPRPSQGSTPKPDPSP